MNLRDHGEVALLLARLTLTSPYRALEVEELQSRFWDHLGYLEHLWSKELDCHPGRPTDNANCHIGAEILVTRLFIRISAASFSFPAREPENSGNSSPTPLQRWHRHCHVSETMLEKVSESIHTLSSRIRLERLQRRLERWGDFLLSWKAGLERFSADPDRYQEMVNSPPLEREAALPLMSAGLIRMIPKQLVEKSDRAAVHRMLQSLAVAQISSRQFLKDGRLKPQFLFWVEKVALIS